MIGERVIQDNPYGGEIVHDPHGDRYRLVVRTLNESDNEENVRMEIRAESTFRAINAALAEFEEPRGRRLVEILSISKGAYISPGDEPVGIQPLEITFER